jgi:hypothetical protein
MIELTLVSSVDPRIVSITPSIASLNFATSISVEIDNFSRWEACELEAAFVNNDLRIPAKVFNSLSIDGRSRLKLFSPLLLDAVDLKIELQCKTSRITSATTLRVINPDKLSVLSYSPNSVPTIAGGILSVLVQSSVHVTQFTASVELSNSVPKSCDLQVEILPNFLYQIRIFVDPFATAPAVDTIGFVRIVPDSRSERFARLQITFAAVQVSLKSLLPSKVHQGLATPVIAEFLNVPSSVSAYLDITSQQTLIEVPEIISCNPSRCVYRFIIDLLNDAVSDRIDLSFSFISMSNSNPISHTIFVYNHLLCKVIDVAPSILVHNRTNDLIIRVHALASQSFNLQFSFGLQEIVGKRRSNHFGSYSLMSISVDVSSTKSAWIHISDDSCSSNLTFPIQPQVSANVIQVIPSLVSSGQTAVAD